MKSVDKSESISNAIVKVGLDIVTINIFYNEADFKVHINEFHELAINQR